MGHTRKYRRDSLHPPKPNGILTRSFWQIRTFTGANTMRKGKGLLTRVLGQFLVLAAAGAVGAQEPSRGDPPAPDGTKNPRLLLGPKLAEDPRPRLRLRPCW